MADFRKGEAISKMIVRLGLHTAPKQVVKRLADLGIDVSETHVRRIKCQMLRSESRAATRRRPMRMKDRQKRRPQQRKIPARR